MSLSAKLTEAIQYHQTGHLQEAEMIYKEILKVDPSHSDALHLLGFIAHQGGNNDLAVELIRQAIQIHPDSAFYYNNLALVHQKATAIDPQYAEAYHNMGITLKTQGRFKEAVSCLQKAVAIKPDLGGAYYVMADIFQDEGKIRMTIYVEEAIVCYKRAIEIDPEFAMSYSKCGSAHMSLVDFEKAVWWFKKAMELGPTDSTMHSDFLMYQHYDPATDARKLLAEAENWQQQYGNVQKTSFSSPKTGDLHDRIRIGYVSPDFRQHSVSMFLLPLFFEHDHEGFEILAHGANSVKLKARVPYLCVFENCLHTFRPMITKDLKSFVILMFSARTKSLDELKICLTAGAQSLASMIDKRQVRSMGTISISSLIWQVIPVTTAFRSLL